MSRVSQQQGMMLLEVIIALAVFAGAALALMNSMSGQMSATSRLTEHLFADWVSANWLAKQALTQSTPVSGKPHRSGSTEMGGQNWSWTLQEVPSAEPTYIMQELTVSHDGVPVRSTLRLLPKIQDPAP
ncbi:type II secretion system protein GspI [Chimaeribacter californicus]|uniref:Type II secretion system protein I n=1 Tax=Chimaeribacter californicus TaxID=2060067 RepID=A0A2N5DVD6_9GAMM|nr:type II secretion system minor pseudopilin GspI [Chimaeribacter californicus]PLR30995.1 type II secretion system protein GspI [Chimaeribacter californicus]